MFLTSFAQNRLNAADLSSPRKEEWAHMEQDILKKDAQLRPQAGYVEKS